MKLFLRVMLCACLAAGVALAQRGSRGGGGGMRGGGGMGHSFSGGGGFRSGGAIGGFRGAFGGSGFRGGGSFGGFRGGGSFGGFRGGGFGFRGFGRGFGFRGFGYWPYYGFGYSYWPWYYDNYYDPYDYPYSYPAYSYPAYQPSSGVTVVYPQQTQQAPVYVERANPDLREYDEYGQQIRRPAAASPSGIGSPLYLIAFKDRSIRAAASYWVEGSTLHYITLQHEERLAPIDSIDRDFTLQLNRERHVQFSLPVQQ